MSEQTEKKRKKYLLIGLCSVLLLGSAGTYAAYKQTEKKEIQSESVEKQGKQPVKKTNRSWEKQVTEKEKNKKTEKNTKEKRKDPLATVDIGDEASAVETVFPRKETSLLGQLAKAITKQEEKEVLRADRSAKEQEKMLALADTPTNTLLSHSLKPSVGEKNVLSDVKKDELVEPKDTPNKPDIPIVPETPETPEIPDIPVPPVPPVPTDPVEPKPDVEGLTDRAKEKLKTTTEEAQKINQRLEGVKEKLDTLTRIEEKTNQNTEKANTYWAEVASLVEEYNQLSTQIKQLITDTNEVLPVNQTLYQEIYTQLQQKVTEIKTAQTNANEATNTAEKVLSEAKETDQSLNEIKQYYDEELNPQAETAKNEVANAINQAQENQEVATNLQGEVVHAEAAAVHVQNNQEKIEQQLNTASQPATQEQLVNAQQSVESLNEQASVQNESVQAVVEDFNQLPVIEAADSAPAQTQETGKGVSADEQTQETKTPVSSENATQE